MSSGSEESETLIWILETLRDYEALGKFYSPEEVGVEYGLSVRTIRYLIANSWLRSFVEVDGIVKRHLIHEIEIRRFRQFVNGRWHHQPPVEILALCEGKAILTEANPA